MLVIRREQFNAFRGPLMMDFLERLERHLRKVHPDSLAHVAAGDAFQELLNPMLASAGRRGLRSERTITLYVDLCIGLGADFEQRPEFQKLARLLREDIDENAKIFLAYRTLSAATETATAPRQTRHG